MVLINLKEKVRQALPIIHMRIPNMITLKNNCTLEKPKMKKGMSNKLILMLINRNMISKVSENLK